MEALRPVVNTLKSGRDLLDLIETLQVPDTDKQRLAEHILKVATELSQKGKLGKENDSTVEATVPDEEALSVAENIQFLVPRGKHDLRFCTKYIQIKSAKQDLRINVSSIRDIAIIDNIPKDTKGRVLLIVNVTLPSTGKQALWAPGKHSTAYVIQTTQQAQLDIASPAGTGRRLTGGAAVVVCQAFGEKGVAPSAFTSPSKETFCSSSGHLAIEAVIGAQQGMLYPLKTALCFLERPAMWIAHVDIASVELARANGNSSTFDLYLHPRGAGKTLELSNISRSELGPLSSYISRSGLRLQDGDESGEAAVPANAEAANDEDESDEEDSDFIPEGSSDDEDGEANAEAAQERGGAKATAEAQVRSDDEGQEVVSASEASSDDDSDISLVSDDDIPSASIRQLLKDDKQSRKKRRMR